MRGELVRSERDRFQLRATRKDGVVEDVEMHYNNEESWNGKEKSVLPSFNTDRLCFTPAFLLPADRKYYLQNETFERLQFKEKIERNMAFFNHKKEVKKDPILTEASPNNNYCQICKQKYDQYFQHTSLDSHMQKARENEINGAIRELCATFSGEKGKIKSKGIRKSVKGGRSSMIRSGRMVQGDGEGFCGQSGGQSTGVVSSRPEIGMN